MNLAFLGSASALFSSFLSTISIHRFAYLVLFSSSLLIVVDCFSPTLSHRLGSVGDTCHLLSESSTVLQCAGGQGKGELEKLKETVDIVEVVDSYNLPRFRRHGTGAMAVCPFHDDKNPSFSVDSTRQFYKCFACGASGDVFRFVQEYSKLPGNEELSFGKVLEYVSSTFGDGSFQSYTKSDGLSPEERDRIRQKKERIILANTLAANFYSNCLVEPFAGGARSHLRLRQISPLTSTQCLIGYAPDCYFGPKSSNVRAHGSLVQHLQMMNFTASEIVEAGLATVLKSRTKTDAEISHEALMDRFRGRLMVPIFDASGKKILGFGGREIIAPDVDELDSAVESTFKTPKYLNTPETLVFEKRHILFGRSHAAAAIRADHQSKPSILVVEGYMDAIALWNAGLNAAVATMGTAVTEQQLRDAAKLVAPHGGRIVLCLDNDEAGRMAVERLCSNGVLSNVSKQQKVEFKVAGFPSGIKDPAEFLETYGETSPSLDLAGVFTEEVVEGAVDWTVWYVQSLLAEYDPNAPRGSPTSFSHIFERVAKYLASALDPADRTRTAAEVAPQLSMLLSKDVNSPSVSQSAKAQLELDLIDASAKMARDMQALNRRTESAGLSPKSEAKALTSLINGGTGSRSPASKQGSASKKRPVNGGSPGYSNDVSQTSTRASRTMGRVAKMKRKPEPASLTPHFGGFVFTQKSDRDWLGLSENKKKRKYNLSLGDPPRSKSGADSNGIVYFNSADYNGHQFLTADAEAAGYSREGIRPNPSVIEFGLGSLLEPDIGAVKRNAEDSLLRVLVQHPQARRAVKTMSQTIMKRGIVWSCEAKSWLFQKLMSDQQMIQPTTTSNLLNATSLKGISNATSLKGLLSAFDDVPIGAFSETKSEDTLTVPPQDITEYHIHDTPNGKLDRYFLQGSTDLLDVTRPDLAAQEFFITLATSTQEETVRNLRDSIIATENRNEMALLRETETRLLGGDDDSSEVLSTKNESNALVLSADQMSSVVALQNATTELLSLQKSAKHAMEVLLNSRDQFNHEGQIPKSLQSSVARQVGEHLNKVIDGDAPLHTDSSNSEQLFSGPDDEPFEDALERMQEEWGDWYDDDYFWSPGEQSPTQTPKLTVPLSDDDMADDESLEEFNERIAREYAGWDIT